MKKRQNGKGKGTGMKGGKNENMWNLNNNLNSEN